MSRADSDALTKLIGALVGGVKAAVAYGEQLAADDSVDLYLSQAAFNDLDATVAFIPNVAGRVALRIVDDEAWAQLPSGPLAPKAAVALDLLEYGDPRHWIAAEHLAHGND